MNESNLYFSEQVAAASERVSNAFDSTKVYSVGEYCTYEGRLYKFVEVKKAGDWDTNTVIETTMANEIYILNTTGIGTGYDVTLSVPVSGWSGDSAPYAQTVQALGMTADKGVIYALMTEGATATASERENYRLITGTQQGPNSVTFYATAKPSIDMTIRCFCGAGSEEKDNIEVVSDAFNASKEYAAGNYCIYGDTLYKFNSAKSAGAWDASKVTSTNVGTELAAVKTDVSMLNANMLEIKSATMTKTTDAYSQTDCQEYAGKKVVGWYCSTALLVKQGEISFRCFGNIQMQQLNSIPKTKITFTIYYFD